MRRLRFGSIELPWGGVMSGYKGLIRKFPVNRPLSEQDRKYHLDQNKKLEVEPYSDLVVIRLNSTFMEVVDKFFQNKGFLSLFAFIVAGCLLGFPHPSGQQSKSRLLSGPMHQRQWLLDYR